MTNSDKQLGSDNAAATGGARRKTEEKSEAGREMAGGSAAEGTVMANTENPGRTNSPDRQCAIHQEKKAELRAS